jgi:hypothetical protein
VYRRFANTHLPHTYSQTQTHIRPTRVDGPNKDVAA